MSYGLLTVTELNEYLRAIMDGNPLLQSLMVRGEISNFTNHYKTGHFYFSLKDETGNVRAVMFRSSASQLRFMPENGMKVIVSGRVSVFPRDGQYQIYVNDMQPDGVGALALAYRQLHEKLRLEGLFDEARKKPLPTYPRVIGVITSPTGAAVRDILNILGRRYPLADVLLYPALVQGAGAAESLVRGVELFEKHGLADVLIIGRGGGSMEDLWAFNDETLARAVAAARTPVISAVGHETDYTILDYVADLRAPTPSAAAELAVPDKGELVRRLWAAEEGLSLRMAERLRRATLALSQLQNARAMQSPLHYIEDRHLQLMYLREKLERGVTAVLEKHRYCLQGLCAKAEALNPLGVLARGYAAVFDGAGRVASSMKDVKINDELSVRFADGTAKVKVLDLRESE